MADRLDRLLTAVLAVAAAVMAAALAHREFATAGQVRTVDVGAGAPDSVSDWPEVLNVGIPLGGPNREVTVVEFVDFECPFCRQFDSVMRTLESSRPGTISRVLIHFPIPTHRFALAAAKAAECSAEQGRFAEVHRLLFAKQDSLGLMELTRRFQAVAATACPKQRAGVSHPNVWRGRWLSCRAIASSRA